MYENEELFVNEQCSLVSFPKMNLTNNYVFEEIFGEPDILHPVLEELTGISISKLVKTEKEYHIKGGKATHSIVCDVLAIDTKGRIYDLEMQNYKEKYQFHRIRFYVGQLDNKYFVKERSYEEAAKEGYAGMSDVYCIWLCNYSTAEYPKGYTECILYDTSNQMPQDNGVHQIFFDIRKYNGDNPRLKELFRYMQEPTDLVAEECQWEVIKQIHKKYKLITETKEKESEYMDYNRAQMIGYRMGEEKGEANGVIKGKLEAITNLMTNLHMSLEKALDVLGIPEPEWDIYKEKISSKDKQMIA